MGVNTDRETHGERPDYKGAARYSGAHLQFGGHQVDHIVAVGV